MKASNLFSLNASRIRAIHLSKEQMPKTAGQTETISADSITLLELEKVISLIL